MSRELKFIRSTTIETIHDRLALLQNYIPLPKTGADYFANYDYFDDIIFPLTNLAVERYKKLVKIRASRLAQNLVETKAKRHIHNMPDTPNGELIFRGTQTFENAKTKKETTIEIVKHLSYREWWTIGAANALCNLLGMCSGHIYWLSKNPNITTNQRKQHAETIRNAWAGYYVEFESCLAQIYTMERAKSGYSTAKKKKTIQNWVLEQARQICKDKKIHSKKQLAEIILRDHYRPEMWGTPLKKDGELNTILRWILNDASIVVRKN